MQRLGEHFAQAVMHAFSEPQDPAKLLQSQEFYDALRGEDWDAIHKMFGFNPVVEALRNKDSKALHELLDIPTDMQFIKAAEKGDNKSLLRWIHGGRITNINAVASITGDTALIRAVRGGHFDTMGLLIDAGIDINIKNASGQTAFMVAAHSSTLAIDILRHTNKVIIDDIDNNGHTAFEIATKRGNISTVKKLLLHHNISGEMKNKALIEAASNGKLSMVEYLIDNGADINARDEKWKDTIDNGRQ